MISRKNWGSKNFTRKKVCLALSYSVKPIARIGIFLGLKLNNLDTLEISETIIYQVLKFFIPRNFSTSEIFQILEY